MSKTQSVFGTELKEQLLSGIKKLNQSVSSTLGPGGRTVLIREANGEVKISKDGVTVARHFAKLENDVEEIGAQLVKQVSIKSANEAASMILKIDDVIASQKMKSPPMPPGGGMPGGMGGEDFE